jgi:hypothetical protein
VDAARGPDGRIPLAAIDELQQRRRALTGVMQAIVGDTATSVTKAIGTYNDTLTDALALIRGFGHVPASPSTPAFGLIGKGFGGDPGQANPATKAPGLGLEILGNPGDLLGPQILTTPDDDGLRLEGGTGFVPADQSPVLNINVPAPPLDGQTDGGQLNPTPLPHGATFDRSESAELARSGDEGEKPPGVPPDWVYSPARSGKGDVYQRPGAEGNEDMVRVMDPTPLYPDGYVRFYNRYGQAVDLAGRPGSRATSHIPRNSDGTYSIPEGW